MNAADIMTRSVVTIRETETVVHAIRLMLDHHVSGLPVTDAQGGLVGIVTEGDLLRRFEIATEKRRPRWLEFLAGTGRLAEDYVLSHARVVADIMTRDVATVAEAAPLAAVVDLMEKAHVRRVPVVTDGHVVGVVSRADLMRALADALDALPVTPRSDAELRDLIVAEVNRQSRGGLTSVSVRVEGAVATLEGTVFDPRERDAIRIVAENVVGAASVRDHLEYIDPNVGILSGV